MWNFVICLFHLPGLIYHLHINKEKSTQEKKIILQIVENGHCQQKVMHGKLKSRKKMSTEHF